MSTGETNCVFGACGTFCSYICTCEGLYRKLTRLQERKLTFVEVGFVSKHLNHWDNLFASFISAPSKWRGWIHVRQCWHFWRLGVWAILCEEPVSAWDDSDASDHWSTLHSFKSPFIGCDQRRDVKLITDIFSVSDIKSQLIYCQLEFKCDKRLGSICRQCSARLMDDKYRRHTTPFIPQENLNISL